MTRMHAGLNLIVFTAGLVLGQSAAAPAFDVVSVKPSAPGALGMRIGIDPGGGFTATNATLKALIQQAYDVQDFQISGGPGWIETERYDIAAKSDSAGASEEDIRKMNEDQRKAFQDKLRQKIRALMADRFHLKVHQETKELPVYALIVAKNGPRIQPSPAPQGDVSRNSGIRSNRTDTGRTEIIATNAPLMLFIRILSNQIGRTVLDKTDLKGNFDFKLTFAPDPLQQAPGLAGVGGDRPPALDIDGPSLFTALQEQTGLKLDAQKGPVPMVVVESAEKATEN